MPWIALASAAVGAYGAKEKAKAQTAMAGEMAGKMSPAMSSDGRTVETVFDNSGWNVSFGSSKIDSTAVKSVDQAGPSLPQSQTTAQGVPSYGMGAYAPGLSGSLGGIDQTTMIYIAVAAVVLIAWKKKK